MNQDRREFLKKAGLFGGAIALNPLTSLAAEASDDSAPKAGNFDGTVGDLEVTILQTTDVHCQIHPHDELFWEDGDLPQAGATQARAQLFD
jgi:hypothetical protein